MIARLQGTILEKMPPEILLDVAGVGYEIQLPMTSFYQYTTKRSKILTNEEITTNLPTTGQNIASELYTTVDILLLDPI